MKLYKKNTRVESAKGDFLSFNQIFFWHSQKLVEVSLKMRVCTHTFFNSYMDEVGTEYHHRFPQSKFPRISAARARNRHFGEVVEEALRLVLIGCGDEAKTSGTFALARIIETFQEIQAELQRWAQLHAKNVDQMLLGEHHESFAVDALLTEVLLCEKREECWELIKIIFSWSEREVYKEEDPSKIAATEKKVMSTCPTAQTHELSINFASPLLSLLALSSCNFQPANIDCARSSSSKPAMKKNQSERRKKQHIKISKKLRRRRPSRVFFSIASLTYEWLVLSDTINYIVIKSARPGCTIVAINAQRS